MKTDQRAVRTILRAKDAASPFVERCLNSCEAPPGALALDIPCGAGRHIRGLQAHGYRVIGADRSSELLKESGLRNGLPGYSASSALAFVELDASRELPFAQATFDAALVIHFFLPGLIARLSALIKPGGYLILETFGAHGGNHVHLPLRGQVRGELSGRWQLHQYNERVVRGAPSRRVTQLFAQRDT